MGEQPPAVLRATATTSSHKVLGDVHSLKNLTIFFLLLPLTYAHAHTKSDGFSKSGASVFVITDKKMASRIKLDIAISNWKVNCAKNRAVIWGGPLNKQAIGVAPYTKIYILDIVQKRILNSYTRTLRVFGSIDFDKSGEIITFDEDVIDLATGELKQIEPPSNLEKESCPDFPGVVFKARQP